MKQIKTKIKENKVSRLEEEDYPTTIDFLLNYRWWYLQCHMDKEYPYTIRYRLVWAFGYNKVKPKDFVEKAIAELLHN